MIACGRRTNPIKIQELACSVDRRLTSTYITGHVAQLQTVHGASPPSAASSARQAHLHALRAAFQGAPQIPHLPQLQPRQQPRHQGCEAPRLLVWREQRVQAAWKEQGGCLLGAVGGTAAGPRLVQQQKWSWDVRGKICVLEIQVYSIAAPSSSGKPNL